MKMEDEQLTDAVIIITR